MALLKKILIFLVVIVFCLFSVLQSLIILAPASYQPVKSDCILILGYALKSDSSPDEWLEERLQKGLELYRKGIAGRIIVSGGQGITDPLPVASAMQKWLVAHAVDEKDIIVEDKAHNTLENIAFSKPYAQALNIGSVIIVTSDFHIFRSMLITKRYFENYSAASAPSKLSFKKTFAYLRETAAVIKYWLQPDL